LRALGMFPAEGLAFTVPRRGFNVSTDGK